MEGVSTLTLPAGKFCTNPVLNFSRVTRMHYVVRRQLQRFSRFTVEDRYEVFFE